MYDGTGTGLKYRSRTPTTLFNVLPNIGMFGEFRDLSIVSVVCCCVPVVCVSAMLHADRALVARPDVFTCMEVP